MWPEALPTHSVGVLLAMAGLSGLALVGLLLRWRRRAGNSAHDEPRRRVGSIQTVRRADDARLIALRVDVHVVTAASNGERRIQITVGRNGSTVTLDKASPEDARHLADRLRKAAARCGVH